MTGRNSETASASFGIQYCCIGLKLPNQSDPQVVTLMTMYRPNSVIDIATASAMSRIEVESRMTGVECAANARVKGRQCEALTSLLNDRLGW
jgi:hypothetical protein